MREMYELSINYVIFAVVVYLASKAMLFAIIRKTITVPKTRRRLTIWALLFSPTLTTIFWLFDWGDYTWYLCGLPVLAYIFDLQALQWVRAIWEPDSATKDLEYSPDITNVDIP